MKRMSGWVSSTMAVLVLGSCLLGASPARAQHEEAQATLRTVLLQLEVLAPEQHQGLTIFPLALSVARQDPGHVALDRVITKKQLSIGEVGSGEVPTLQLSNHTRERVFLMTGEIVTGAKQDRMSAQDVLIPPGAKSLAIKVYCVEQGRWVMKSSQFQSGASAGTKNLRQSATRKESQSKIWSDVASKSSQSNVDSGTGTMQAVYEDAAVRKQLAAFQEALKDLPERSGPEVVGYVALVHGSITHADLFADHRLFADLWPKLLKADALDAITEKNKPGTSLAAADIQQFLSIGLASQLLAIENPGLGEEFLLEGSDGSSGSVLLYQNHIVHLALFTPDQNKNNGRELRPDFAPDQPNQEQQQGLRLPDRPTSSQGNRYNQALESTSNVSGVQVNTQKRRVQKKSSK